MIKDFIKRWTSRGDEKSDTQKFWLELIRDVLGRDAPENFIEFEKRVELSHVSYIDAYINSTGIVIEQKSFGVSLDSKSKSSDGNLLTPFEQAKRYYDNLPYNQRGRYIITCNFQEFRIYDMNESSHPKAKVIKLADLAKLSRKENVFSFLLIRERVYTHEELLSIKAGKLAEKLYKALEERYVNPDDESSRRSLNILCVRLVFLLYAEDSPGVFSKSQFHNYLRARIISPREALIKLFEVLDLKHEERSPYLDEDLKLFPHVNGGLFYDKNIEIPRLDGEPLRIILEDMSEQFDWSGISPTIFGAVFESILAKFQTQTRDTGGMHYTSIENIHKLIDPLFMDDFNKKFAAARTKKALIALQDELASYSFFDPACGSGNFLTESYLSLRRLENKIIAELYRLSHDTREFAFSEEDARIKISISQFYGIEINDFAVNVAKTALWIANIQMLEETKKIIRIQDNALPLSKFENIRRADALKLDWNEIITPSQKLFIMGNPPFAGYATQTPEQKEAIRTVCGESAGAGKIDYVCGWYYKAVDYIKTSGARAAFVSTNSIIQGDQVYSVWESLRKVQGFHIDFACQSFKWDNELPDKKIKAHVYVVIIGFSRNVNSNLRKLYTPEGNLQEVSNINFYLSEGNDEDIARSVDEALDPQALRMFAGGKKTDGGNLVMTHDEMQDLITANPVAKKLIRPYKNGEDFINRKPRYCLWLVNADPDDIAKCPLVMQRIKKVKEFRLKSSKEATQRKAKTPALFDEIVECDTNYIAVPKTSSEKRFYIPIDWLPPEVIPGDGMRIIPGATLYHFGILTSRVHMAWMRRVAGRLKIDYSYSNTIVYNTFAWPKASDRHRAKIESTAQAILDARAKFPKTSFASLYNDDIMPPELKRAHELNDNAVCEAYGWDKNISESGIISRLFIMYHELVKDISDS